MCKEVAMSLFQLFSWHSLQGPRRTTDSIGIYAWTSNSRLTA